MRKVTVHDDAGAIGAMRDIERTGGARRDDVDNPRAFVESQAVYRTDFAQFVTAGSSLGDLCPKRRRLEC